MGNLIACHNRGLTGEQVNIVLMDLEAVVAWASMEYDPMYNEIPLVLCLAYKEALPKINPISFHLYGFLEEFSLWSFGNWNR